MLDDTKLIKQILVQEFPNNKFSLKHKRPSNYIDSSDKIIITCKQEIKNNVKTAIDKYTNNIKIYESGSCASIGGDFCSKIYNTKSEKFVDADIEFIEIKSR